VTEIRAAAVLGAGTMGSGIAAHLANAGIPVTMFDLGDAAVTSAAGLGRRKPPPLVDARAGRRITPAALDDLGVLREADWIVEAIVEDLDAKRELYRRLEPVRKRGSIVSSNTSTIPLAHLLDAAPESLAADFMITHFFNPPRYMQLLEVVPGPATRPEAVEAVEAFADLRLGKAVVRCNDTPGFVANRLGVYWIATAIGEALARGLTVEEADVLMGEAIGAPRTGVFGLMDLVGIGLHEHVTASLDRLLPADDPWRAVPPQMPVFRRLVEMGATGRAAGRGFYARDGSRRLAIDLETFEYRPAEQPRLDAAANARRGLAALIETPDRHGAYARAVLIRVLAYAAAMVPEVADSPALIDLAMTRGYNWRHGPFAMIDAFGADRLAAALDADGLAVPPLIAAAAAAGSPVSVPAPPRPGVLPLSAVKAADPFERSASATLWNAGDGVAVLEFHTKANAIDDDVLEVLELTVSRAEGRYRAVIIYNEGRFFCTGGDLGHILMMANVAAWDRLAAFGARGQAAFNALKYAPFPVIGAPSGRALGGGCEVLLHCDAVQAHTETYMGLVELGVGLLPAWGGCKELLQRAAERGPGGPMAAAAQAFEVIAAASVSTSAQHAQELGYLRPTDRITPNRDRLLADSRALALELADGYAPPEPPLLTVAGASGRATLELTAAQRAPMLGASAYDLELVGLYAWVLTGGDEGDPVEPVPEAAISALELEAIDGLIRRPQTIERIGHMLAAGKPLRN